MMDVWIVDERGTRSSKERTGAREPRQAAIDGARAALRRRGAADLPSSHIDVVVMDRGTERFFTVEIQPFLSFRISEGNG
jgi:hypothetical protein